MFKSFLIALSATVSFSVMAASTSEEPADGGAGSTALTAPVAAPYKISADNKFFDIYGVPVTFTTTDNDLKALLEGYKSLNYSIEISVLFNNEGTTTPRPFLCLNNNFMGSLREANTITVLTTYRDSDGAWNAVKIPTKYNFEYTNVSFCFDDTINKIPSGSELTGFTAKLLEGYPVFASRSTDFGSVPYTETFSGLHFILDANDDGSWKLSLK